MLKAAVRPEFDVIMAWPVDRLGRSPQQGVDTSTPSGKAMFQMMGVFAEFERAMVRERVLAGLKRARAKGKKLGGQRYRQLRNARFGPMLQPGSAFGRVIIKLTYPWRWV
jgi:Resolvase, N terminal domain